MRTYEIGLGGRSRIWVVAVLVAVVFTVLGTPRAAWAHNVLVSTSPAADSTVATPPEAVVLTFNEPAIATGTMVLVTGPDGSAAQGQPRLVDNTVRQDLAPGLPAGAYTVEWRVTSADGHPVNGTFTFRARDAAPAQAGTSASANPTPSSTPATSTASDDGSGNRGSASGWWWLLAIIPVGLAVALGWRFSRRNGS